MNTNKSWIRITDCQNIPVREGRSVKVAGREVAIFNLGDRFLAIENRCPHRGGPLSDGIVSGTTVVCPLHAWKVNLETGTVASPPGALGCVATFDVRVQDGFVLLAIPAGAPAKKKRVFATEQGQESPAAALDSGIFSLDNPAVERAGGFARTEETAR